MWRVMAAALALTGFAGLAEAQGDRAWSIVNRADGTKGAAICPISDPNETGNFWCLSLACSPGEPLSWLITILGGDLPDGTIYAPITVDGRQVGVLQMERTQLPGLQIFERWDDAKHRPIVEALKSGSRAQVSTLQGPVFRVDIDVPLANSRNALTEAERLCPAAAALPRDPVRADAEALVSACAEQGGTVSFSDGFALLADVTGDGTDEIFVQHARADCSAAGTLWCGTAGCPINLYRDTGDGWAPILETFSHGFELQPSGGPAPFVDFFVHGSSCGGSGADACTARLQWDGAAMTRIEMLSP